MRLPWSFSSFLDQFWRLEKAQVNKSCLSTNCISCAKDVCLVQPFSSFLIFSITTFITEAFLAFSKNGGYLLIFTGSRLTFYVAGNVLQDRNINWNCHNLFIDWWSDWWSITIFSLSSCVSRNSIHELLFLHALLAWKKTLLVCVVLKKLTASLNSSWDLVWTVKRRRNVYIGRTILSALCTSSALRSVPAFADRRNSYQFRFYTIGVLFQIIALGSPKPLDDSIYGMIHVRSFSWFHGTLNHPLPLI